MVLHNDKWAKKAKRSNDRRKGISSGKGHGGVSVRPIDKLDMGRVTEDGEVPDPTEEDTESTSDEDSFEFDSGDEGKTPQEKALAAASRLAQPVSTTQQPSQAHVPTPKVGIADRRDQEDSSASPKIDKRFARRKLYDNASRYEEAVLDPYMVVENPEPEVDYKSMAAKSYSNPKEVELVPDDSRPQNTPLPMNAAERSHFDKLKQMQQKEEYARDMKMRFGQRRGFGPRQDPTSVSNDETDDAFFDELNCAHDEPSSNAVLETTQPTKETAASGGHEHLEKFLDDLLKI